MSSDKNSHLQAAAKLARKHGVNNFVAVCPFEHDLAWSEDSETFYQKAVDAEQAALQAHSGLTILRPNLAFGNQSHLIHFLAQCAIVGKVPYKNLVSADNHFQYAPVHTNDIASALGEALSQNRPGRFSLAGPEKMTLRQIMDVLERSAGRNEGSVKGPLIPTLDWFWDFFVGTTSDLNMSRMVSFYE